MEKDVEGNDQGGGGYGEDHDVRNHFSDRLCR